MHGRISKPYDTATLQARSSLQMMTRSCDQSTLEIRWLNERLVVLKRPFLMAKMIPLPTRRSSTRKTPCAKKNTIRSGRNCALRSSPNRTSASPSNANGSDPTPLARKLLGPELSFRFVYHLQLDDRRRHRLKPSGIRACASPSDRSAPARTLNGRSLDVTSASVADG